MNHPLRIGAACAALLAACLPSQAFASVLAVGPTDIGSIAIVDVDSHDQVPLEIEACCAIQTGTVTADKANHRVFFIAADGGVEQLYTFVYGIPASVDSLGLSNGQRVTHLVYDPVHLRFAALVADDAGGVDPAIVSMFGRVAVTGTLGPDCCSLRAGVAAYDAAADLFYAVGRRTTDSTDQLFAFSITQGTLLASYPLGSESVSTLLLHGGVLYALSYDAATDALRAATITFTPGFALTPIGSGAAGCCFVLAGSAALDHARNTLVALTRSSTTIEPFAIRSFSLADGTVTQGFALAANGLFEDTVPLSDRIFADDFEGP